MVSTPPHLVWSQFNQSACRAAAEAAAATAPAVPAARPGPSSNGAPAPAISTGRARGPFAIAAAKAGMTAADARPGPGLRRAASDEPPRFHAQPAVPPRPPAPTPPLQDPNGHAEYVVIEEGILYTFTPHRIFNWLFSLEV